MTEYFFKFTKVKENGIYREDEHIGSMCKQEKGLGPQRVETPSAQKNKTGASIKVRGRGPGSWGEDHQRDPKRRIEGIFELGGKG